MTRSWFAFRQTFNLGLETVHTASKSAEFIERTPHVRNIPTIPEKEGVQIWKSGDITYSLTFSATYPNNFYICRCSMEGYGIPACPGSCVRFSRRRWDTDQI